MSYENRGDSEYHSSSYEYRIPSDEMKNRDNEFQTGQRSRAVNAAEDQLPLRNG